MSPADATDDSITGQVEDFIWRSGCITFDPVWGIPSVNEDRCVSDGADTGSAIFWGTADRTGKNLNTVGSLVDGSGSALAGVLGEVTATLNEVTGGAASLDVSYEPDRRSVTYEVRNNGTTVHSGTVDADGGVTSNGSQSEGSSSTLNSFKFVDTVPLRVHNSRVDGRWSFEIYSSTKSTGQWRVWGSATNASVRGINGGKVKYVLGSIQPTKSYMEAVSWSPKSVQTYSSGTTTLAISPSIVGNSAGSISRSWERTAGKTGGYMTSTDRHDAVWEGAATANARGLDALQSWKAPKGQTVQWRLHGLVKYYP